MSIEYIMEVCIVKHFPFSFCYLFTYFFHTDSLSACNWHVLDTHGTTYQVVFCVLNVYSFLTVVVQQFVIGRHYFQATECGKIIRCCSVSHLACLRLLKNLLADFDQTCV